MHVQQPLRPGALVEVVNILGDEQQLARPLGVQPRQRPVGSIGLDRPEPCAARIVEGMDQRGVALEGFRSRDILDAMTFPETVGSAEGREAASAETPAPVRMTILRASNPAMHPCYRQHRLRESVGHDMGDSVASLI